MREVFICILRLVTIPIILKGMIDCPQCKDVFCVTIVETCLIYSDSVQVIAKVKAFLSDVLESDLSRRVNTLWMAERYSVLASLFMDIYLSICKI
jgi:hypothetical protein